MTPNGNVTDEQIRMAIKRLIARITEREPEEIPDQASLTEELGVDSLMAMEVMVAVDKEFHIDIPEEEFNAIGNVDEAVAVVKKHLPTGGVAIASV
jgi:acyl carrier protein